MAKDNNIRALVLESITEADREETTISQSMQETLRKYQYFSKQERSFYTRLCQGTVENRLLLDYLLDQVSSKPMRRCKPYIRNLLRMSLYQLRFMNGVPESAVCNEAVKLAEKKGYVSLKGFVNGVLRNLIRRQDHLSLPMREEQPVEYLSVMYSVPEWLVREFIRWYGRELTEEMLAAFLQEAPLTVRINQARGSKKEILEQLNAEGIQCRNGCYTENTLRLTGINYVGRMKPFREGLVTVQDESSVLQGFLIHPLPGARILDLCAAPGGKALYAAERLLEVEAGEKNKAGGPEPGFVLAQDISEAKLKRIRENAERMKYPNVRIKQWDARKPQEELFQTMDIVIADLPCSGLGVIGRKPDIKYRLSKKQINELVSLQRDILRLAGQYVKPGGYLIYSTCTLDPAENQEQIRWMQETYPFTSVSIEQMLPKSLTEQLEGQPGTELEKGYCTLLPGWQSCDGFFLAVLKKDSIENEVETWISGQ